YSTSNWNGPSPATGVNQECLAGDFNGDGLMDMACYGGSGSWTLGLSTGSSFATQTWTSGITLANPIANYCLTGDFNGDGRTDVACYPGSGGSWQIILSTGQGFSTQTWGGGSSVAVPVGSQCIVGDFSGDGLADIACYIGTSGNWALWLS